MFSKAVRSIIPGAVLALLLPLSACDTVGALGPEAVMDPLNGAVLGGLASFEGKVAVVDLERSAIVFSTGVRIEVNPETHVSGEHEVPDLETAAAWLEEGFELVGWGEGVVASEDPPVIDAASLTIKVGAFPDDGDGEDGEGEGVQPMAEYEGIIASVDLDAGTLSLSSGILVRVVDGTQISDDFGIPGLAAAKEHLEAGDTVVAWGHGEVESEAPVVIVAAKLVMKLKGSADPDGDGGGEDAGHAEYEGIIVSIDLDAGVIDLANGMSIRVVEATEISDDFGIASLAAAKEHLEAGDTLFAWGHGELESEDPVVIEALSLIMKVKPASDGEGEGGGEGGSDHVAYEGAVVAIDVEAGSLSLESGKVIRVIEETQISDDFGLPSLVAAREALEDGAHVVAWGEGEVESEEPLVIVALTLVMQVQ